MGYNTASTEWPEPQISEPIRQLIDGLFATLDDSTDAAGDRLADEIFSSDGEFAGSHAAKGTEEIRHSRRAAWNVVQKRRHEVLKVYVNSPSHEDLLLLGQISVVLKNEKEVQSSFAARVILSYAEGSQPKVQMYQAIADTAPVMQAMKE